MRKAVAMSKRGRCPLTIPDFLLLLSSRRPNAKFLGVPRHGIWSFVHGEDVRPGAPHFNELDRGRQVTCVTLTRLVDGRAEGETLQRGYFQVLKQSYSRTLQLALVGCVPFPALACEHVIRQRAAAEPRAERRSAQGQPRSPNNAEMGSYLARLTLRKIHANYRWACRAEQWSIGIVSSPCVRVSRADVQARGSVAPDL